MSTTSVDLVDFALNFNSIRNVSFVNVLLTAAAATTIVCMCVSVCVGLHLSVNFDEKNVLVRATNFYRQLLHGEQ